MKNMLLIDKNVPSGGPLKVLLCMDCGKGSATKDILSHNGINDLTEGIFSNDRENKPFYQVPKPSEDLSMK